MGKTGKWIKNFLLGKKDKEKTSVNHHSVLSENQATPITIPPTTPREKRRWSFRRSSATGPTANKDSDSFSGSMTQSETEQKKHVVSVMAATIAAADAAVAAAQAATALIRLNDNTQESAAATKIQSVFRSYLARKALSALKGLVKLQALVRGHLVRKQATATLRCMQALVTVQERARAQRIRMSDDPNNNRAFNSRNTTPERRSRTPHHDSMEENIKIVEMDQSGSTNTNTNTKNRTPTRRQSDPRFQQNSPAPTVMTEMSPRASSGYYYEDYSPHYYSAISKPDPSRVPFRPEYAESMSYEYPSFPSYMANTESSRAKVRSQSAPKQRPVETFEKQLIKRRPSIEGRNVPRAVRMQRSSSHVGSTVQHYQYPWSVKLDKSLISVKDSECGSNSTMLTDINYCRSLIAFDEQGNRNY